MSDYIRNKAVMYPIDQDILDRLSLEDAWELAEVVGKVYPTLFTRNGNEPYFEVEAMDPGMFKCNYYLSYVLSHTYGKECSEFGRSRFLNPNEQKKYSEIFEKIISNLDPTKLKYVDYSYYNCSESPDFYVEGDDFNNEI